MEETKHEYVIIKCQKSDATCNDEVSIFPIIHALWKKYFLRGSGKFFEFFCLEFEKNRGGKEKVQ